MIIISKEWLEVAKRYRLLYDGNKGVPANLNRQVNPYLGRTYKTTKHNIFVTSGEKGIYKIIKRIIENEKYVKDKNKVKRGI